MDRVTALVLACAVGVGIEYEDVVYLTVLSSVQEFMVFTSQVLIERTSSGERKTVKEQGANMVHE